MNKLKYIVYKELNNKQIIIFPEDTSHEYMFNSLGISKKYLISAGFVKFNLIDDYFIAKCYGEVKFF